MNPVGEGEGEDAVSTAARGCAGDGTGSGGGECGWRGWLRHGVACPWWTTGINVRHLGVKPAPEVGDLCVDPKTVRVCTAKAPTDHANQGLGSIVGRIRSYERSAGVPLAGVLAAFFDTGADHVWGHEGSNLATVAVVEHLYLNLIEMSHSAASRGEGPPACDDGLGVSVGCSFCGQAGRLDVRLGRQVHSFIKFKDGDVILSVG